MLRRRFAVGRVRYGVFVLCVLMCASSPASRVAGGASHFFLPLTTAALSLSLAPVLSASNSCRKPKERRGCLSGTRQQSAHGSPTPPLLSHLAEFTPACTSLGAGREARGAHCARRTHVERHIEGVCGVWGRPRSGRRQRACVALASPLFPLFPCQGPALHQAGAEERLHGCVFARLTHAPTHVHTFAFADAPPSLQSFVSSLSRVCVPSPLHICARIDLCVRFKSAQCGAPPPPHTLAHLPPLHPQSRRSALFLTHLHSRRGSSFCRVALRVTAV